MYVMLSLWSCRFTSALITVFQLNYIRSAITTCNSLELRFHVARPGMDLEISQKKPLHVSSPAQLF